MANRFKDVKTKFSGHAGPCWHDYVSDCDLVCRDNDVTDVHKLQFRHNLLDGKAKHFYLGEALAPVSTFAEDVQRVHSELHSVVQKIQEQHFLSSLRMSSLYRKGMFVEAALEETYKFVAAHSKMLPAS